METEIACEKITTEIMIELADLFDEEGWILYEAERHRVISSKVRMAVGVGFDEGRFNNSRGLAKRVTQFTKDGKVIRIWRSIQQVQRALGINNSDITHCARGKHNHKTAGGFIWKYTDQ